MPEGIFQDNIDCFTIDRRKRTADFSMGPPHYHPYYELYYLCSGQCRMFIHNTIYYAAPGDIFLIPPSRLHRTLYGNGGGADRYDIRFIPSYLSMFSDHGSKELDEIFSCPKLTVPAAKRSDLELLLSKMERETSHPDAYSQLQIQSLLVQLLIGLARLEHQMQTPATQSLKQTDEAIQKAVHYIHRCHRQNVTLKSAAQAAHMSTSYFSKKFKETTGFGFKEYLTHLRIQDSENLLRTTALPITEIALTCGFSDGNYFGDAFRKIKGISPNQYRKQKGQ